MSILPDAAYAIPNAAEPKTLKHCIVGKRFSISLKACIALSSMRPISNPIIKSPGFVFVLTCIASPLRVAPWFDCERNISSRIGSYIAPTTGLLP